MPSHHLKIIVTFFLWLPLHLLASTPLSIPNHLSGESLLLINAVNGCILYAKQAETPIYPASMTKVATALFILSKHPEVLEKYIPIKKDYISTITPEIKKESGYRSPPYWLESDGSNIGLKVKEEVLGKDLFFSLLVCSANDAANALAGACYESIPKFMDNLNLFLRDIGCTHTHFNNPHGLHHPDHFSTARDLAIIFQKALQYPLFREAISTTRYKALETNLDPVGRVFLQTNKMILPSSPFYYKNAIGGKTGSTKSAGKNLICAASSSNREVIVIATGYHKPISVLYNDVKTLFEAALNEPTQKAFLLLPGNSFTLSFRNSWKKVKVPLPEGIYYHFFPSEGVKHASMTFIQEKHSLPIPEGTRLGEIQVFDTSGTLLSSFPIHTNKRLTSNIFSRILMFFTKKGVLATFLFSLFVFTRKKNARRPSRSIFS